MLAAFREGLPSPGGDHRATVQAFERRAAVHLPRDEASGTVVSLDAMAARNPVAFTPDIRGIC